MHTAKRIYAMLGNENLWDAAHTASSILEQNGICHAVVGGVAVCLHGYQRNTIDVDLLVNSGDAEAIRQFLETAGWTWESAQKQFVSESGIVLQFLLGGERSGVGSEVRFPDPADQSAVTRLEGLPVLKLEKLIETKLASGQGDARRMHKDFADVVELIAVHTLNKSFSRKLDQSLRQAFLELVERARG